MGCQCVIPTVTYFDITDFGINESKCASNFLKHLLMVTSLISLTRLTSRLLMFNAHVCAMKYTMPAAIECGVFSGMSWFFSIRDATNKHSWVSSAFMLSLLQYRSINKFGVVLQNVVLSEFVMSDSISLIMTSAFLHPRVALVMSSENILAISFAVRGQL